MHLTVPARLTEVEGTVTQFLMNEHGELDGFILDRSCQVHFPPGMSASVAAHVLLGDTVRVHGVFLRGAGLMSMVALDPEDDETIVNDGSQRTLRHDDEWPVERVHVDLVGTVVLPLYSPKGELRGALLGGGTSLRMTVSAAAERASYLTPGARVHAWGELVASRLATTLDVEKITLASVAHCIASTHLKTSSGITACLTGGRG